MLYKVGYYLYVGSEIEFKFMHQENDFIASNPLSISQAAIARTFISNMFLPCFLFDLVRCLDV